MILWLSPALECELNPRVDPPVTRAISSLLDYLYQRLFFLAK